MPPTSSTTTPLSLPTNHHQVVESVYHFEEGEEEGEEMEEEGGEEEVEEGEEQEPLSQNKSQKKNDSFGNEVAPQMLTSDALLIEGMTPVSTYLFEDDSQSYNGSESADESSDDFDFMKPKTNEKEIKTPKKKLDSPKKKRPLKETKKTVKPPVKAKKKPTPAESNLPSSSHSSNKKQSKPKNTEKKRKMEEETKKQDPPKKIKTPLSYKQNLPPVTSSSLETPQPKKTALNGTHSSNSHVDLPSRDSSPSKDVDSLRKEIRVLIDKITEENLEKLVEIICISGEEEKGITISVDQNVEINLNFLSFDTLSKIYLLLHK